MRLFLKTCRLQHILQCRHSEQENVSRFTTRFFPPIIYRPREGFPATLHAHSMRLCLPPDDCMLTHFHIFQGNGSPECARGGRSVNKSRAIALHVSTNSVWLLQHCQLIQFIMRESIRGKAGKEKQKTAPKKYPMILCNVSKDKSPSIQYYFAKYPCFVFCLPCHIRRGKPAEQIAPSSFVMQRDETIQDSKCAPLHHPARHGYTRSRQGAKSRRGCPENGTASC